MAASAGSSEPAPGQDEESDDDASALGQFRKRLGALARERKEREVREAIIEFQSDSIEIEKGPPPRVARATAYTLLALFAFAITWASWAHVDRVVTATGQLVTKDPQIIVQPLETAVIRSIFVRPGDIVHKDDPLALLDATFVGAELDQLESQRSSFQEQVTRLQAELNGEPYQPVSSGTQDALMQTAVDLQRRSAYQARLADLDAQVAKNKAALEALVHDIDVLEDRLAVAHKIEDMRAELKKLDAGSQLQLLVAQNTRLEVTQDLERSRNRQKELRHEIAALQAQREAFMAGWRQEAASDLVDATRQLDNIMDQLRKVKRRQELIDLRSPEDAVVLSVAQRTVGSVQQAAEPLMTLVPLNSPLEAEVRISPADIGRLSVGLPSKIKIAAFPFQKHGMLEGELRVISENTFSPNNSQDSSQSYYRGLVDLTSTKLRNVPKEQRLLPGMTLTAEIKLGERSVISYFLYPLIRTFDESLREP
ncbi:HlyD family type I secretion periplasmic adaptor subunit [Pararhodospirillum oryzae]|uniref:Membrane fusion protein (MFP) family protein n=1 Tax=Pararhodospirillum oryzae TaxID=478448 RepID=A0A512H7V8_9PROT|nr:HlyD family type I secretion periplasmic adaptor subunit [Pararhodospirillum oryzae]GEO81524.1 membrane-fusion protein [Pararhodospirillum oryzae]